jgi:hypothetical protein
VERERGKGKEGGESIHPSTPIRQLLNGILYAGWWRVRKRKGKVDSCPFRKKNKNFLDFQSVLLEPSESLNTGLLYLFPSHVCRASKQDGAGHIMAPSWWHFL